MIKNYFKIAWRTIWKNKIFSGINIFGLSLGLTCSILIMMWVQDEYNVDSFHKNLNRIFAVTSTEYMDGTVRGSYDTPGLLADELSKTIPDIELACAYGGGSYRLFSSGEKKIKLLGSYASPDFFKIFSYPLIEGTALDALNDPDDIAISEKMAISFFGSSRTALGQSLKFDNYKQLKISAVFKDIASNSSERFEYILNWEFYKEREPWLTEWHNSGAKTFVLLKSRMDISNVNSKIKEYISRYDKEYKESDRLELALQPYGKKYLYSNFKNGVFCIL